MTRRTSSPTRSTLVVGVVARRGPGLPPRRLGRQALRRRLPVVHVWHLERRVPARDPGGVAEDVAQLDLRLAVGGELGPVVGHRRVGVEQAAVDQHQRGEIGHRLGRRPDVGDGVLGPGRAPLGVAPSTPDVHHGLAVDVQHDTRAELLLSQLLGQRVAHRRKARIARPRHLGHRSLLELAYRSLRPGGF